MHLLLNRITQKNKQKCLKYTWAFQIYSMFRNNNDQIYYEIHDSKLWSMQMNRSLNIWILQGKWLKSDFNQKSLGDWGIMELKNLFDKIQMWLGLLNFWNVSKMWLVRKSADF